MTQEEPTIVEVFCSYGDAQHPEMPENANEMPQKSVEPVPG